MHSYSHGTKQAFHLSTIDASLFCVRGLYETQAFETLVWFGIRRCIIGPKEAISQNLEKKN